MSKLTVGSVSIALAAVLAAGHAEPVTAGGISKKQTRNIIKKEIARLPRTRGPKGPRGPRGPAGARGPAGPAGQPGPAGANGTEFLHAHVFSDGSVEAGVPGGIFQENVRRVDEEVEREIDHDGDGIIDEVRTDTQTRYCFSDLPPLSGGNVTIDTGFTELIFFPYLQVKTQDPDCSPMVIMYDGTQDVRMPSSFYILLY